MKVPKYIDETNGKSRCTCVKKEDFLPLLILLVSQTFISSVLFIMLTFLSLFLHFVIGGLFTFSLYAAIWWFIWWGQYGENGIAQFYPKLIFATMPLVAFTTLYIHSHPTPTYMTMIPLLPAEIHFDFSTAVTCTLLFPLYSIALQKYFLPQNRIWFQFVCAASGLVAIGTVIFTSCYHFLPTNW
jgi:hypothetical protein